jgi:hypothetical protein
MTDYSAEKQRHPETVSAVSLTGRSAPTSDLSWGLFSHGNLGYRLAQLPWKIKI